jgi:CBS domain-containing protein
MQEGSVKHKEFVTVSGGTSASRISKLMEEEDVSSVVVSGGDEPVGIVTDHDVRNCVYGQSPSKKTAEDIMSKRVLL